MSLYGNRLEQGLGYAGQIDGPINHEFTKARTNPAKPQKGTLTVGGTADDGTYSITVTNPQEPGWSISVSFLRAAAETNAQIAAALSVKLVKAFILKAGVTVLSNVITVEAKNTDITYAFSTSAPGTGTLVWAQTVAPGGTVQPFGRFYKGDGTGFGFAALESGDAIATVIGGLVRELTVENNQTIGGFDGCRIGYEAAIAAMGPMLMDCEEDVTPADTVYIRRVASGNKTMIGAVGKSADGGNCISAATIARFAENSANGFVRVDFFIPLPNP